MEWSSYRCLGNSHQHMTWLLGFPCEPMRMHLRRSRGWAPGNSRATHPSPAFKCAHGACSHRNRGLGSSVFYCEGRWYFMCINCYYLQSLLIIDERALKSFSLSSWDFCIFNKYLFPSVVDPLLSPLMLDAFLPYFQDNYSEVTPCLHPTPSISPLHTSVEFPEREIYTWTLIFQWEH